MSSLPAIGVLSWLAAGVAAAIGARFLPPRAGHPGWPATLAIGAAGGLAGGLLAAGLEFGGTSSLDLPALVVAALAAALAIVLVRLRRTSAAG